MQVQQTVPPKARYIIRAKDKLAPLAAFIESTRGDSGIELVDSIGPAGQVHTVVVEVDAGEAPQFERRFTHSDELMIERDQPLSLFR